MLIMDQNANTAGQIRVDYSCAQLASHMSGILKTSKRKKTTEWNILMWDPSHEDMETGTSDPPEKIFVGIS